MSKQSKQSQVFINFEEYWYYAKLLTIDQREVLLNSLNSSQRKQLMSSYRNGGWEDLVIRNEIDKIIDNIKKDINIDLIQNRCNIVKGRSISIKKSQWEYIQDIFKKYKECHTNYILAGIKAEELDDHMVLLVKE